jgi:outer membrane protein TolC
MPAVTAWRFSYFVALAVLAAPVALAQSDRGATSPTIRAAFEVGPSEQLPSSVSSQASAAPADGYHLSLDEAKSRVLQYNVAMTLTSLQVTQKCHALAAARKDYLPKLLTAFSYFHFDQDLGTVVKTPGIFNPATAISVPVVNQDAPMFIATAIQPITPLFKVREAVNIAEADVGAAQAQRDDARRELIKGVDQLYFGLMATQKIHAGLEQAVAGAKQMASAAASPEAQIDVIQAQQSLLEAETQLVSLSEQLVGLVGLPSGTKLQLDEPPRSAIPFATPADAIDTAVATSPKLQQARAELEKAESAMRVAQDDFMPTVLAYALYSDQQMTPVIQADYTGIGVTATYTLEWGKKNDTLHQWQATVCLARENLKKETDDVRLDAAKAYIEANRAEQALGLAEQLAKLSGEVHPPANDPMALKAAAKAGLEAQVAAIKAEMDYRTAVAELCVLAGRLD